MSKEQYNSFDDWFREAADQPGPPVHDAAWLAMEAKLDGQKKRRRAIIFWWWLGGLFLTGAIFMVARMNTEAIDNWTRANIEFPANTPVVKPDNTVGSRASTPSEQTVGISGKEKTDRSSAISPDRQLSVKGLTAGNKIVSEPKRENNENSFTRNIITRKQKTSLDKTDTRIEITGSTVAAASIPEKNAENKNELISGQDKALPNDSLVSDTTMLQKEKTTQSLVTSTDSANIKKAAKTPEKTSHFYVFGAVAPEWSYVKNQGPGDVSISYGFSIGYGLSKKWAIQAGVFLAGKKYVAGEGDYTPKKGSYYDDPNMKIESVDADCAVFEIPLSMRYTFLQKKKYQFFAMVSFASTVMKRETYAFDYVDTLGISGYKHKTYKTGAFNLFSTATLSVGMESRLSKHFSLLFAPYFNIPLQGIGEGKVYINSFGLQGGLKYNLPF